MFNKRPSVTLLRRDIRRPSDGARLLGTSVRGHTCHLLIERKWDVEFVKVGKVIRGEPQCSFQPVCFSMCSFVRSGLLLFSACIESNRKDFLSRFGSMTLAAFCGSTFRFREGSLLLLSQCAGSIHPFGSFTFTCARRLFQSRTPRSTIRSNRLAESFNLLYTLTSKYACELGGLLGGCFLWVNFC